MSGDVTIGPTATLTLAAGSRLGLSGAGLYVAGTLQGNGTASAPISLTTASAAPAPGQWEGIAYLRGSGGTLSYAYVSYTGQGFSSSVTGCCYAAGIVVEGASPSIGNVTVDQGSGNGIEITGAGNPHLSADRCLNNSQWAIHYDGAGSATLVGSGLSASGNYHDGIGLGGLVTGTMTVRNPGLPFYTDANLTVATGGQLAVSGPTSVQIVGGLTVSGTLNLSSTVLLTTVMNGASVQIYGTLNLSGTATQPISVTGALKQVGSWGSLTFAPGSQGMLSYAHLSNGGVNGGTVVINGASPTISNSTIDGSEQNDVWVTGGGQPVLRGDSFGPPAVGGAYAVDNIGGSTAPVVYAQDDWWGSASGPSGAGHGSGVGVSPGVTYTPWLQADPRTTAITVSPTSGSAGTTAIVMGTNFGPGETVNLYWNDPATQPLTTTTAGTGGGFTVAFSVPQAVANPNNIVAIGQNSSLEAQASFVVTPTVTASIVAGPTSATPFQTITVTGTSFGGAEPVNVYWDSAATTPLITPTTTLGGGFVATVSVPQAKAGTHALIAMGQHSGKAAYVVVPVKPTVLLYPSGGKSGSVAYLVGAGFGATETVAGLWDPGLKLLNAVKSNAMGTAVMSFTVPMSPTATYDVIGYGLTSKLVAVAPFGVSAVGQLGTAPAFVRGLVMHVLSGEAQVSHLRSDGTPPGWKSRRPGRSVG